MGTVKRPHPGPPRSVCIAGCMGGGRWLKTSASGSQRNRPLPLIESVPKQGRSPPPVQECGALHLKSPHPKQGRKGKAEGGGGKGPQPGCTPLCGLGALHPGRQGAQGSAGMLCGAVVLTSL